MRGEVSQRDSDEIGDRAQDMRGEVSQRDSDEIGDRAEDREAARRNDEASVEGESRRPKKSRRSAQQEEEEEEEFGIGASRDSEDEDEDEDLVVEKMCEPSDTYETKESLESKQREQGGVAYVEDLKGKLVWGTFMVISGSDFKHRRCRAEVLVERGPPQLCGSRVSVVGTVNRNRAWHFDKCWVRVFMARIRNNIKNVDSDHLPWREELVERCALYGTVVRAEPSFAPRQTMVVCARSRIVRSKSSMTFRVINGKFPLVQVKWNPTEESPSLRDLHLVEIVKWEGTLPEGRYLHPLEIDKKNDDASLLFAISRSLNFCDWEDAEPAEGGSPQPAAGRRAGEAGRRSRKRRQVADPVVGIQHACWPCSMAFSVSKDRSRLQLHLPDVNEYLDGLSDVRCAALEEIMRRRAVGVRFEDYQGDPMRVSLPLLPQDVEDSTSFREQKKVLAVTFSFQLDERFEVDIEHAEVFESLVTCQCVLSHQEVEAVLRGQLAQLKEGVKVRIYDPSNQQGWDGKEAVCSKERAEIRKWAVSSGGLERTFRRENLHILGNGGEEHRKGVEQRELLRILYRAIEKLEQSCLSKEACTAFEHVEPDFASGEQCSEREGFAASLLAGCSFLVNRCAGDRLQQSDAWAALISSSGDAHTGEVPSLVANRPDSTSWAAALRLFPPSPSKELRQVQVPAVLHALQQILRKHGLTHRERRCLQETFLRKVRSALPHSAYRLATPESSSCARASTAGNFFNRERIFNVSSPLLRYLDVLGLRALKLKEGWCPAHRGLLRPTWEHLQEALERTNLRQDASRVASFIFKQLTVMRLLEKGSKRFDDCLVGGVGPGSFDVLVPLTSSTHLPLKVPVSAMRGPSCVVDFVPEEARLKVMCVTDPRSALQPATWSITPWGSCRVSCPISLNFAQPVRQHANGSAVLISDITFTARTGGGALEKVSFGLGHRMFPEVFSQCPDLHQWHLINHDISAYVDNWYGIRQCQVHAGAALSAGEGQREALSSEDLDWTSSCRFLVSVQPRAPHESLYRGDLAVLHLVAPCKHQEVVLYGSVTADPRQAQSKTALEVVVELSKVSASVKQQQQEVVDMCAKATVQFMPILQMDKKSLEMLQSLPHNLDSPIVNQLMGRLTPKQKEKKAESPPLAPLLEAKRAVQGAAELNTEQRNGILIALQRPFSVVQGPPGTGKTSFLVHLVASLLKLDGDMFLQQQAPTRSLVHPVRAKPIGKILICAPSNQAAEEVLHRLIRDARIPDRYITRVYARCIEAADGSKYGGVKRLDDRCDVFVRSDLQEHALHFKTQNVRSVSQAGQGSYDREYERAEVKELMGARIVVTTCTTALFHAAFEDKRARPQQGEARRTLKFGTVIIDEAAQATELDVVFPALLAQQRVVVVGDHMQLGPVVKEQNLCRAYLQALEKPILERLCENPQVLPVKTMLCTQYRMHCSLREFPSNQWYSSELKDHADQPESGILKSVWPKEGQHVTFIDSRSPHEFGATCGVGKSNLTTKTSLLENKTSVKNVGEAKVVASVFERLVKHGKCSPADIAVVTHYRAQKDEIVAKLRRKLGESALAQTTVGTVHTLQGSERKYVIVSFVRSTAEGVALAYCPEAATDLDIVVSVRADNLALRQTCEANIGIVNNSKALNVSLTRARHGLVCVGNCHVLSEACQDFFDLCQDLRQRGCIQSQQEFEELGKA